MWRSGCDGGVGGEVGVMEVRVKRWVGWRCGWRGEWD